MTKRLWITKEQYEQIATTGALELVVEAQGCSPMLTTIKYDKPTVNEQEQNVATIKNHCINTAANLCKVMSEEMSKEVISPANLTAVRAGTDFVEQLVNIAKSADDIYIDD